MYDKIYLVRVLLLALLRKFKYNKEHLDITNCGGFIDDSSNY
jgi:hypothetical protein